MMPRTYRVKAGDTLQTIAVNGCGSIGVVRQVMKDNQLTGASALVVGMELTSTARTK